MSRSSASSRALKCGFTFLELVVVIGIIGVIVAGIGLIHLNQTPGAKFAAAERLLVNVIQRAKTLAGVEGVPVRIIIHNDESDPDLYRRQIALIAYRDGKWVVSGNVMVLPGGIGVLPDTTFDLPVGWDSDRVSVFSGSGQSVEMNVDGRGMREFQYLEFMEGGVPVILEESDYLADDMPVSAHGLRVLIGFFRISGGPEVLTFLNEEQTAGVDIMGNGALVVMNR